MASKKQKASFYAFMARNLLGVARRMHRPSKPYQVIGLSQDAEIVRHAVRKRDRTMGYNLYQQQVEKRIGYPPATYSPKGAFCHACGEKIEPEGTGRRFRLNWMHERCLPETRKRKLITPRTEAIDRLQAQQKAADQASEG